MPVRALVANGLTKQSRRVGRVPEAAPLLGHLKVVISGCSYFFVMTQVLETSSEVMLLRYLYVTRSSTPPDLAQLIVLIICAHTGQCFTCKPYGSKGPNAVRKYLPAISHPGSQLHMHVLSWATRCRQKLLKRLSHFIILFYGS